MRWLAANIWAYDPDPDRKLAPDWVSGLGEVLIIVAIGCLLCFVFYRLFYVGAKRAIERKEWDVFGGDPEHYITTLQADNATDAFMKARARYGSPVVVRPSPGA